MSGCVAIIGALPREVRGLVKGWEGGAAAGGISLYTRGNAVVACAGMGGVRASVAVQAALAVRPIVALISVGLAGACDPALRVGDVVRAGVVVDSRTGERFLGQRGERVLVTADGIASVGEKARLFASYHAQAVDMEAATVARLARAHGLEFQAIKSISDEAEFGMEEFDQFVTSDGRFREAAFAGHAALRPRLWSNVLRLARDSRRALEALTCMLESEIDWYRHRSEPLERSVGER